MGLTSKLVGITTNLSTTSAVVVDSEIKENTNIDSLGVLLIIAGLGYLIDNLRLFLFPNFNFVYRIGDVPIFIMITGSFELIFMLWLLIKGSRI